MTASEAGLLHILKLQITMLPLRNLDKYLWSGGFFNPISKLVAVTTFMKSRPATIIYRLIKTVEHSFIHSFIHSQADNLMSILCCHSVCKTFNAVIKIGRPMQKTGEL